MFTSAANEISNCIRRVSSLHTSKLAFGFMLVSNQGMRLTTTQLQDCNGRYKV